MSLTLEIRLKGGLLIGGGESDRPNLDDATVRDRDGVPFIPASAIKGAIREQMLRIAGEPKTRAILGGKRPGANNGDVEDREGKITISDAVIRHQAVREIFESGLGYSIRQNVSIDRRSRRSSEGRLFQRQIVAPFIDGVVFCAEVNDKELDSEGRRIFLGATRAVFAIGSSRSAGLGGVALTVVEDTGHGEVADHVAIPDAKRVVMEIEAQDDLCLGGTLSSGNFFETLNYVPSTTLRGAVISAALRAQGISGDQSENNKFRKMFLDPDTCLRFGDAYPVHATTVSRWTPLTLHTCKFYGEKHGEIDTLLQSYLQWVLAEQGIFVANRNFCPFCGARTEPVGGSLVGDSGLRFVRTRLAMDAQTARGKEGSLYSMQLVERGSRFKAVIDNITPDAVAFLRAATGEGLRLGKGKRQGMGAARIVGFEEACESSIATRVTTFDKIVKRMFRETVANSGAPTQNVVGEGYVISATLLSDMAVDENPPNGEDALIKALGIPGASLLFAQVRTGQRGGYDTLKDKLKAYTPVLRAGSCALIRIPAGTDGFDRASLAFKERQGIGERREEGFGWVRLSDERHKPGWRDR